MKKRYDADGTTFWETYYNNYCFRFWGEECHIVDRNTGECFAYASLDSFDETRVNDSYLDLVLTTFRGYRYDGSVIALGKINLIPPNAVRFIGGIPE